MMYETLRDNLTLFISTFGIVKRRHIMNLFAKNHAPKAIKYHMDALIRECRVLLDEDGNVVSKHSPHLTREYMMAQFKALDVLCNFQDTDIRAFYPAQYPCSLLFITEDNDVYDVTVIDYNNYNALSNLIPIIRSSQLPKDIEDIVYHIAVVPSSDFIPMIANLPFDQYCVLDDDGNPEFYELNH